MKTSIVSLFIAVALASPQARAADDKGAPSSSATPAPPPAWPELVPKLDAADAVLKQWIDKGAEESARAEKENDVSARTNAQNELERLVAKQQQLASLRRSLDEE